MDDSLESKTNNTWKSTVLGAAAIGAYAAGALLAMGPGRIQPAATDATLHKNEQYIQVRSYKTNPHKYYDQRELLTTSIAYVDSNADNQIDYEIRRACAIRVCPSVIHPSSGTLHIQWESTEK